MVRVRVRLVIGLDLGFGIRVSRNPNSTNSICCGLVVDLL